MNDLKKLLDRPIAFQRSFVPIAGSVHGALFLSQAFYWANRTSDPDGWFYKTQTEWEEETGLTRREQDGARAKLRAAGVLEEKLMSVPARLYYRVDVKALLGGMHQTAKLDAPPPPSNAPNRQTVCTKPPNCMHQTAKLLNRDYTETTSETTSAEPESEEPDSADCRILCESIGIFNIRQQEEVHRLYKALCRDSKLSPARAREKIIARWDEYQRKASECEWKWGSAYKFLISGLWDKPDMWPRKQVVAKSGDMAGMKFFNEGKK